MPAIPAAIMAGSAIAKALIDRSAAKKAAKTQATAAEQAGVLGTEAADKAALGVTDATRQAQEGVAGATSTAISGVNTATEQANELLKQIYGQGNENLAPYMTAGGQTISDLTTALAPGGEFNRTASVEDIQLDPGFAFRMAEGQKALERSASARGSLLGGGTLKALARYSQGVASDEYGRAWERYRTGLNDRFGRLYGVAGMGLNATGQANNLSQWYGGLNSQNLMQGAQLTGNYGMQGALASGNFGQEGARLSGGFGLEGARLGVDALIGAANARAAGTVGAANAVGSGIAGAGNAAAQAWYLNNVQNQQPNLAFAQPTRSFIPPPLQPYQIPAPPALSTGPVNFNPWAPGTIPGIPAPGYGG